jgi:fused signal recognition particle receptor
MFGSNDDKKAPAPSATPPVPPSAEKPAEKKDLFGWLRKKPQEPASSQAPVAPEPTPGPAPEPQAPVAEIAAPAVEPVAPPASVEPAMTPTAAPAESVAEPVPAPRPSRFRINAGSEVLHPVVHQPVPEPPAPVAPIVEPPALAEALLEQNKPGDNQGGWFARLKN